MYGAVPAVAGWWNLVSYLATAFGLVRGALCGAASGPANRAHGGRACVIAVAAVAFTGCASRTINPYIEGVEPNSGYHAERRQIRGVASDTMIILAFSGGGTRAAALSYRVLEELRRTELTIEGSATRISPVTISNYGGTCNYQYRPG